MPAAAPPQPRDRLRSIDLVRSAIMALMVIDHARFYLSGASYPPEDLQHTTLPLFLTRFVTHFCAPGFFLLAGISARLATLRSGTGGGARAWLLSRGAWLVLLELTIVGFAWAFTPGGSFAGVIWGLGWSFILLAALLPLPAPAVGGIGLAVIVLRHLVEGVSPSGAVASSLWKIVCVPGRIATPSGWSWFVLYPIVPWAAVMAAGYGLGDLFAGDADRRARRLRAAGLAAIAAFVLLRLTGVYGHAPRAFMPGAPTTFAAQSTPSLSLIAFLDTEKYPPSLEYLLMTLGPILLALGALARRDSRPSPSPSRGSAVLGLFGRTPMAFYIAHLYIVHLLAYGLARTAGMPAAWLGWNAADVERPDAGYGFALPVVYAATLIVLLLLVPLCARVDRLKARGGSRLWRYL